jgi:hypothetical protein
MGAYGQPCLGHDIADGSTGNRPNFIAAEQIRNDGLRASGSVIDRVRTCLRDGGDHLEQLLLQSDGKTTNLLCMLTSFNNLKRSDFCNTENRQNGYYLYSTCYDIP